MLSIRLALPRVIKGIENYQHVLSLGGLWRCLELYRSRTLRPERAQRDG